MRIAYLMILPLLLVWSFALPAAPLNEAQIPPPLHAWQEWVLHGHASIHCPTLYHREQRICAWPGVLHLDLDGEGGRFHQVWQVEQEGWVVLPGDRQAWPQEVTANGERIAVSERNGRAAVWLAAGEQQLAGEWQWPRLPDLLTLAETTGLLALQVNGNPRPQPEVEQGRLRLRGATTPLEQAEEDHLELRVFRRVVDEQPLRLITRLELNVAGQGREALLGKPLLEGFIPLELQSQLPARLEGDGTLRAQLRPGRWVIEVTARHPEEVTALHLPPLPPPWPSEEIWSVEPRPALRLVEVEQAPQLDPRQTALPDSWKTFPAYHLTADSRLVFKVLRRGNPDPEPNRLTLQRTLWLDFDGGGYSVRDRIGGTISRELRLNSATELHLGRVEIDAQPRFITLFGEEQSQGVEVRHGPLNLIAESRILGAIDTPLASGWQHAFQQVEATLQLPPGWRLLATSGVDQVATSWVQRWTLLDLFLVLIAAIASARLWGLHWGAVVLLALTLTWHEVGAPRFVWLHLLAAVALLRLLPPGRIRQLVAGYRNITLLVLVIIALPFLIDQVRSGLYPQLGAPSAPTWQGFAPLGQMMENQAPELSMDEVAAPPSPRALPAPAMERSAKGYGDSVTQQQQALEKLRRIDPNAIIQTGPGLPDWQWQSVTLRWNGPLTPEQRLQLYYLPPRGGLLLNLLSSLLLLLIALRMLDRRTPPKERASGPPGGAAATATLAAALLLPLALLLPSGASHATALPTPHLLEELQQRLLAPPPCLPACATIPRMHLGATPQRLYLGLEIHTQEAVAVPLPIHPQRWHPDQVAVNGVAQPQLLLLDQQLWLRLEPGIHHLLLSGPLEESNSLSLPLPLTPHHIAFHSASWRLDGVDEWGRGDRQLRLTRISDPERAAQTQARQLEPGLLPPFVEVERTLRLDLEWEVETRVLRRSPADQAILLRIPLLPGESVLSEQLRVEQGQVLVNMPPQQREVSWRSTLAQQPELQLQAPSGDHWSERWRLALGLNWHAEWSGIAPLQRSNPASLELPEWRPWPGEVLHLHLSRPSGSPGPSLTLEQSRLRTTVGKRSRESVLELQLRSSRGDRHTLLLPPAAELQEVRINGQSQPVRQQGREVTLPLSPGTLAVVLRWQTPLAMAPRITTPELELGLPGVNHTSEIHLARDRWVLLTRGPQLGPAVLFWALLLVLMVVASGLGRYARTPLRSHHWLLLAIGLSQAPILLALVVVAWLLALDQRARIAPQKLTTWSFNLLQIGILLLTLAALGSLFHAVQHSLLGLPEMQVAGNGSSAYQLYWYQDRIDSIPPAAEVISLPLLVYRLAMLAWALWLAFALLRWLRWGWASLSHGGLWRPIEPRLKPTRSRHSSKQKEEEALLPDD